MDVTLLNVTLYTFEDASGEVAFHTFDAHVAEQTARQNRWRVTANTYEWADSEPVEEWDFLEAAEDDDVEDESDENDDGGAEIRVTQLLRDEGSIVLFQGIDEDGDTVTFACEHSYAQDIVNAIERGEDPVASVPDHMFWGS